MRGGVVSSPVLCVPLCGILPFIHATVANLNKITKVSASYSLQKPTLKSTIFVNISLTTCLCSSQEEWVM